MINLISLARAGGGQAKTVPKTSLYVQLITENTPLPLKHSLWLTLLEGDLLIDLPHGDFRHLEVGDSMILEPMEIQFTPVEDCIILWQEV